MCGKYVENKNTLPSNNTNIHGKRLLSNSHMHDKNIERKLDNHLNASSENVMCDKHDFTIMFIDWKKNDKSSLTYAYSDDVEKDTGTYINVNFMVENKWDPEASFYDIDDPLIEDLRNSLESNLNILKMHHRR